MNPEKDQENWYRWLEFFYDSADFGPAHEDVVQMIYEDFVEETGIHLIEFEGDN